MPSKTKQFLIDDAYHEFDGWLQAAANDVAACSQVVMGDNCTGDDVYNDTEVLEDMIGDHLYGNPLREEILKRAVATGHTALATAASNLLKRS